MIVGRSSFTGSVLCKKLWRSIHFSSDTSSILVRNRKDYGRLIKALNLRLDRRIILSSIYSYDLEHCTSASQTNRNKKLNDFFITNPNVNQILGSLPAEVVYQCLSSIEAHLAAQILKNLILVDKVVDINPTQIIKNACKQLYWVEALSLIRVLSAPEPEHIDDVFLAMCSAGEYNQAILLLEEFSHCDILNFHPTLWTKIALYTLQNKLEDACEILSRTIANKLSTRSASALRNGRNNDQYEQCQQRNEYVDSSKNQENDVISNDDILQLLPPQMAVALLSHIVSSLKNSNNNSNNNSKIKSNETPLQTATNEQIVKILQLFIFFISGKVPWLVYEHYESILHPDTTTRSTTTTTTLKNVSNQLTQDVIINQIKKLKTQELIQLSASDTNYLLDMIDQHWKSIVTSNHLISRNATSIVTAYNSRCAEQLSSTNTVNKTINSKNNNNYNSSETISLLNDSIQRSMEIMDYGTLFEVMLCRDLPQDCKIFFHELAIYYIQNDKPNWFDVLLISELIDVLSHEYQNDTIGATSKTKPKPLQPFMKVYSKKIQSKCLKIQALMNVSERLPISVLEKAAVVFDGADGCRKHQTSMKSPFSNVFLKILDLQRNQSLSEGTPK